MDEETSYQIVLNDLKQRRDALNIVIAAIEAHEGRCKRGNSLVLMTPEKVELMGQYDNIDRVILKMKKALFRWL